ncbi:transglutaminase domain-containing protein [Streptomyces nigra]|uniref:transglutaminase domain-containing protein n=1 Tax=Streptomyces nigra TaxID=1827580 RepID=UPI0013DD8F8F|nr:transglutaminase domain-containing protein [Streptomyces nigra]
MEQLRNPAIDEFSRRCRDLVATDAALCGTSPRDFDIQLRLHAPSIAGRQVGPSSHSALYDELRPRLIARCSRIAGDSEQADLLANSSLLLGGGEVRRNFTIKRTDGSPVGMKFAVVPPSVGHLYQARLHYLLSPRADTFIELGCYLQGASHPSSYLAFSMCDRPGTIAALQAHGLAARRDNVLVLTRALGLSDAARNLMSFTIGQAVRYVRALGCKFVVTAFNPLLGFTGSALHASNFTPFASAPVAYCYDSFGNYLTRRQSMSDLCTDRRPENYRNLLVVLGTDSTTRKETRKVKTLHHLAEPSVNGEASHPPRLDVAELLRYREHLEAAWSKSTAHPSYALEPLSSKGQCGVSSVWLARLLRQREIEATYCYGRLRFEKRGYSSVDHHCWIEVGPPNDPARQVIDLTCDQADGFEQKVICERYEKLVDGGIYYEPVTRLAMDELPRDRVWPRYTRLEASMREKWGMQTLYESV